MVSAQEDESRAERSEWAAGLDNTEENLESTGFNSQCHVGEMESLRGKRPDQGHTVTGR